MCQYREPRGADELDLEIVVWGKGCVRVHCSAMNIWYTFRMTTREKVESLIQQTTELPEEAQAEFVQTILEMRFQNTSVYRLNDDERAALDRSEEDVRAGRLVSEDEMGATFARYRT
jgi:hypothetical protein